MKIMLDAGHHESTKGKQTPDGYKEHTFNEGVTNHAAKLLKEYQNVEVFFADDEHYDTPLDVRADKANKLGVDLFVSAHANAFGSGWNAANGIETYVYKTKPKEAVALAERIQNHLVTATGLTNRGVKPADFAVLRDTKMTGVLVECGFMTNPKEAALIKTVEYQQKCAAAIVKGIAEQYSLKKKVVAKPVAPPVAKPTSAKEIYRVQVGAFGEKTNADRLAAELKSKGYAAIVVR